MPVVPPSPPKASDFDLDFVLRALCEEHLLTGAQCEEVRKTAANVRARLLRSRSDGDRRKSYEVSPIEIVALYNFSMPGRLGVVLDGDHRGRHPKGRRDLS